MKQATKEKIDLSCVLGKKSVGYYYEIIKALEEDKESPRNEQFFRSVINSKINIAKATSRLMSSERSERVLYLKQSWELYKSIIGYVEKDVAQEFRQCFVKEMELTREMIAMMPTKIDRVNAGQLTFID